MCVGCKRRLGLYTYILTSLSHPVLTLHCPPSSEALQHAALHDLGRLTTFSPCASVLPPPAQTALPSGVGLEEEEGRREGEEGEEGGGGGDGGGRGRREKGEEEMEEGGEKSRKKEEKDKRVEEGNRRKKIFVKPLLPPPANLPHLKVLYTIQHTHMSSPQLASLLACSVWASNEPIPPVSSPAATGNHVD